MKPCLLAGGELESVLWERPINLAPKADFNALAWVQHCRVSWLHALVEVSPLGAWGPGAAQKSAKRCDVAVTVTRTGR